MSERSERIMNIVFFGAQRRSARWCPVETDRVNHLHDSMGHQ